MVYEREPISLEDLVYGQMGEIEAIMWLLVKRGVSTK